MVFRLIQGSVEMPFTYKGYFAPSNGETQVKHEFIEFFYRCVFVIHTLLSSVLSRM